MAMVPHCIYGVIARPPHCYMRGQSEWGTMSSTSGMDVCPVLSCFSTAVKQSLDPTRGSKVSVPVIHHSGTCAQQGHLGYEAT